MYATISATPYLDMPFGALISTPCIGTHIFTYAYVIIMECRITAITNGAYVFITALEFSCLPMERYKHAVAKYG